MSTDSMWGPSVRSPELTTSPFEVAYLDFAASCCAEGVWCGSTGWHYSPGFYEKKQQFVMVAV